LKINFPASETIQWRLIRLPKCHSTNDIAADYIKTGEPEGTVIVTDHQLSGRGQHGNLWESRKGKNLTFSIIFKPDFLKANQGFSLNMAVSVGICEAVSQLNALQFKIKWPNDIYFGNRKAGGILIENFIATGMIRDSIIGIGVNVNQEKFDTPKAISILQITRKESDLQEILNKILRSIEFRYRQLKAGLAQNIRETYFEHLYMYQCLHEFKAGGKFTGKIVDVDGAGRLVIKTGDHLRTFNAKEVEFLEDFDK
jgi:BirA family biotin operon repressor/biotin-[acetyl-CoA-carboxylase] ligase